jgi:hypothetical protein
MLILSSHLHLGHSNGLFPYGFQTKIFNIFFTFPLLAVCFDHLLIPPPPKADTNIYICLRWNSKLRPQLSNISKTLKIEHVTTVMPQCITVYKNSPKYVATQLGTSWYTALLVSSERVHVTIGQGRTRSFILTVHVSTIGQTTHQSFSVASVLWHEYKPKMVIRMTMTSNVHGVNILLVNTQIKIFMRLLITITINEVFLNL